MPNVDLAIQRAAEKWGIRPDILKRQIMQESGGRANAVSPAGARGIAQFMPATAKAYGVNLNDGRISDDLDGAARYMRDNLKRTGGDYAQALSIYNSGRPDGYKRFDETRNYVKTILGGETPAKTRVPSEPNATLSRGSTSPNVPDRRALIAQYLATQGQPDSLTALAAGLLQDNEDVDVSSAGGRSATGSRPVSSRGLLDRIAREAQKAGLRVGENPRYGGVAPVHVQGSHHYSGDAADISGDPAKMAAFARYIDRVYGGKLTELFWQGAGGVNRKNGKRVPQGFVDGHKGHLHVAIGGAG